MNPAGKPVRRVPQQLNWSVCVHKGSWGALLFPLVTLQKKPPTRLAIRAGQTTPQSGQERRAAQTQLQGLAGVPLRTHNFHAHLGLSSAFGVAEGLRHIEADAAGFPVQQPGVSSLGPRLQEKVGPSWSSEKEAERERLALAQRLLQVQQDESFGETNASLATEMKHPAEFVIWPCGEKKVV